MISRAAGVGSRGHRIGRALLLGSAIYTLLACALGVLLAERSLHPERHPVRDNPAFRALVERQFGAPVQEVSLEGAEGAELRAWFVQPAAANGQTVIILHGLGASRADSTGFAQMFLSHGYAVLLPDSRGHGDSGGATVTYGILEREDVRRWLQWVHGRVPGCTFLLGESLGAAIALETTAIAPEICAVAVEDPYASFREISFERLAGGSWVGTRFWQTLGRPVVEVAILYASWRYRIWLPDASPLEAVERSRVPSVLIAGTADHEIPMHHAVELERACPSHCQLWVVPGAEHGSASSVAHREFEEDVVAWFQEHDRSQP